MIEVVERPSPGINLVGFLHGELGLGEIARKWAAALERADIPFAAIPYRQTPSRQEHPLDLRTTTRAPYDTNLLCLNADELCSFAADVGVEFISERYSIGVWFWETSVFRDPHRAWVLLDEVWAPSEYVRRAIAREIGIPVHIAPIPIEPPPEPTLTRADLGLPEGFVFLFVFDFVSAERKNPLAIVDAFRRAFAPSEGPTLVLKSINGTERKPRQLQELRAAATDRPDIRVVDGYVSAAERDAYIAHCDCYVSLHRSEGFGLTMAEAMAHGRPVIATGYSGNLEFMDDQTAYLVPHRLVPVPTSWWAYAPGAEWAEPDAAAAAELMRSAYDDHSEARTHGSRARAAILERLSVDRASEFVVARLGDARGGLGSRAPAQGQARRAIAQATVLLASGAALSLAEPSRRRPVSRLRRLLVRALWPYLVHQQRLDEEILSALHDVTRSLHELSARVEELDRRAMAPRGHGGAVEAELASSERVRAQGLGER